MTWSYIFYSFLLMPVVAIGYVVGGLWLGLRWARKSQTMLAALSKLVGVVLVLVLIPGADVALGRIEFDRLCTSSAGVKVYQSAQLADKYRAPDGSVRRERLRAGSSSFRIGDRYVEEYASESVTAWPKIDKFKVTYIDQDTGELLAEYVTFHYWGGWLHHSMPGHRSAESCDVQPRRIEAEVFPRL